MTFSRTLKVSWPSEISHPELRDLSISLLRISFSSTTMIWPENPMKVTVAGGGIAGLIPTTAI
jgi:hypothetical protein